MTAASLELFRDQISPARDLASIELWERSLARSRHRRRIRELGRRARRRRKSISLAMSAALAGGTVFPQAVGVASADSGSESTNGGLGTGADAAATLRNLLQFGNRGQLVAAAQQRLNDILPLSHLAIDGIYGPLTRGAVVDFQIRHGLQATGTINVRTWATLFNAPVLLLDAGQHRSHRGASSAGSAAAPVSDGVTIRHRHRGAVQSTLVPRLRSSGGGHIGGAPGAANAQGGEVNGGTAKSQGTTPPPTITAVAPTEGPSTTGSSSGGAAPQLATYVLAGGVALPLPRQYLVGGYVDQGVDYSAPGGTPEYAMGPGMIIGEGISGFGPGAPILEITSGPLKGLQVYYGHSGTDLVRVGQHVSAGEQITEVGYGIVGISTGPHLEIGFYPPGSTGTGARMLGVIQSLLSQHRTGRVWATNVIHASADRIARRRSHTTVRARVVATSSSGGVAPVIASASPPPASSSQTPAPAQLVAPAAAPAPAAPTTAAPTATTSTPTPPAATTPTVPPPTPTPSPTTTTAAATITTTPTAPVPTTTSATSTPTATTPAPGTAPASTTPAGAPAATPNSAAPPPAS